MPVDDPTRPRHVAWEHDWDVWVRIATTTAVLIGRNVLVCGVALWASVTVAAVVVWLLL